VYPGSTNDRISYPSCVELKQAIDSLPLGLYGFADAAYTLLEKLFIQFLGVDCLDSSKDAFNYYLSQLPIHVEMAFGQLVNMFCILSGKIEGRMDRASAILIARARLYNCIIHEERPFGTTCSSVEEEMEQLGITAHKDAPYGMSYLPFVPNEEVDMKDGISHTGNTIVQALRGLEIDRPAQNIECRQREPEQESMQMSNGENLEREHINPL
jgi:hypothetical protein